MLNARGIPATKGQENNLLQLRSGKANGPQRAGNMCRFALQDAPSCNAKRTFDWSYGLYGNVLWVSGIRKLAPLRNIITKTGLRHPMPLCTTAATCQRGNAPQCTKVKIGAGRLAVLHFVIPLHKASCAR